MSLKIDNPFEQPLDASVSQAPPQPQQPAPRPAPSPYLDNGGGLAAAIAGAAVKSLIQPEQQPQQQQQQQGPVDLSAKHGTASFFHVFFKAAALLTYLFSTWFSSNFVLIFVACVLLLAFDFWTVKNVTGRLLVGLRWWNEVKEDGQTVWIFESKPAHRQVHPTESLLFWSTLYGTPLFWMLFGVTAVAGFKFQWLLIVIVALVLSFANVVGFWKCEKDAKKKVQMFLAQRL